jgi:proteasome lid subunit RPN8/RPN11
LRKSDERIIFGDQALPSLRNALLSNAPREAAALLLAGRAGSGEQTKLLVRELFLIPEDGYQAHERLRVVIDPFIMPVLKKARKEGLSLVLTHTHPFAEEAHFSPVDDEGERVLMPSLFARTGGVLMAP